MFKKIKNRHGEHFGFALIAIFLSITITLIAFVSEENKITGFATVSTSLDEISQQSLIEFKDVNSLNSLAVGNYYIDGDGIVYYMDDTSRFAIAKVNFLDDAQKNRHIYIDSNGNIGYVIS